MPGIIQQPSAQKLSIKPLHPTFAAEVEGVDFQNLTDETFQEILAAMAKVHSPSLPPSDHLHQPFI